MEPSHRNFVRSIVLTFAVALTISGASAQSGIHYSVSPGPPAQGKEAATRISMRIQVPLREPNLTLQMARWSPGDYHWQDHGKFVKDLTAKDQSGSELATRHPDPHTWMVTLGSSKQVTVTYTLPNTPPGYFSENVLVTPQFAFYNLVGTLMSVKGVEKQPCTVTANLPTGWKGAVCPLPSAGIGTVPTFQAPDFDTLADSPLLIGDHVSRTFTVDRIPHTLAFFNRYAGMDYDGYAAAFKRIVTENSRVMGGLPYQRYVVFVDAGGRGGGLEHLNSHRMAFDPSTPAKFAAGGMAHEHFHAWNVKRIRPLPLGPFDYQSAPRTGALWLSEGVTSYYGALCLLRSGQSDLPSFLREIQETANFFLASQKRSQVSLDESSRRVFEVEGSSGFGVNYYAGGEVAGFLLDLKIRKESGGKTSLDTVMRDLMERYGLPKAGFPEDGIRDACIRAGGESLGPFYELIIRSAKPWPYKDVLALAGISATQSGNRTTLSLDPVAPSEALALRKAWLSGRD